MKYEFTGNTRIVEGHKVYQIRCTETFGEIIENGKKTPVATEGDLGGWIEQAENLSQVGKSWIYPDAVVMDKAFIRGDARVCGHSIVKDFCTFTDDVIVEGGSRIEGKVFLHGKLQLFNARLRGVIDFSSISEDVFTGIITEHGKYVMHEGKVITQKAKKGIA